MTRPVNYRCDWMNSREACGYVRNADRDSLTWPYCITQTSMDGTDVGRCEHKARRCSMTRSCRDEWSRYIMTAGRAF